MYYAIFILRTQPSSTYKVEQNKPIKPKHNEHNMITAITLLAYD